MQRKANLLLSDLECSGPHPNVHVKGAHKTTTEEK